MCIQQCVCRLRVVAETNGEGGRGGLVTYIHFTITLHLLWPPLGKAPRKQLQSISPTHQLLFGVFDMGGGTTVVESSSLLPFFLRPLFFGAAGGVLAMPGDP